MLIMIMLFSFKDDPFGSSGVNVLRAHVSLLLVLILCSRFVTPYIFCFIYIYKELKINTAIC